MSTLPCRHRVRQGEHISRIAEIYGFFDYRTIWDHSENAALRALRTSPNVLYPGDEVYVPEKQQKSVRRPTTAVHTFTVRRSPLKLRVRALDFAGRPFAGPARPSIEGEPEELELDGDGVVEVAIRRAAAVGDLLLPGAPAEDGDTEAEEAEPLLRADLRIGVLDPIDTETGQNARLINLGYLDGPVDGPFHDAVLRLAVENFQVDNDLPFTGEIDDATRAKLVEVHGA